MMPDADTNAIRISVRRHGAHNDALSEEIFENIISIFVQLNEQKIGKWTGNNEYRAHPRPGK